ncbi:hypothetical protein KJ590_00400 [Patescibacteria group bacterium]|nr:hypothetical protein [Patescibacteria group bacterium]
MKSDFRDIGELAEKVGQTAGILSGLVNVIAGTLSSDNKLDVNLAKSDFARPEDRSSEGNSRNILELAKEAGKLTDILVGYDKVLLEMIQPSNSPCVKS